MASDSAKQSNASVGIRCLKLTSPDIPIIPNFRRSCTSAASAFEHAANAIFDRPHAFPSREFRGCCTNRANRPVAELSGGGKQDPVLSADYAAEGIPTASRSQRFVAPAAIDSGTLSCVQRGKRQIRGRTALLLDILHSASLLKFEPDIDCLNERLILRCWSHESAHR